MNTLVRSNATVVWSALTALTVLSWVLGTDLGLGSDNHAIASVAIIVVSVFKVRLVGLYFMELRDAPAALRGGFEAYIGVLTVLLIGLYLLA